VNIIPRRPCGARGGRSRTRGKRLRMWNGLLSLHGQHGNLIRITHPLSHHLRHSPFPSDLPQVCLALVRRVNLVGLKNNLSKTAMHNLNTICLPIYALCHPMPYLPLIYTVVRLYEPIHMPSWKSHCIIIGIMMYEMYETTHYEYILADSVSLSF